MALTKIDDRGLKTPIDLLDNEKIRFGTGNDLQIYHNGNHSFLENTTGDLYLRSDDDIFIQVGTGDELAISIENDNAVKLYYDASKKFETTSDGVHFTGHLFANDDGRIKLGSSQDLQIYHHSSHDSYIVNDTGFLGIKSTEDIRLMNSSNNELMVKAIVDGGVELYHNNVKKFETTSSGATITGGLYCSAGQQIQITGSAGSVGLQLIGQDADYSLIGTMGAHDLMFRTSSAERMRIAANGVLWHGVAPFANHFTNRSAYFHKSGSSDWNYISITGGTSGGSGIVFGDSIENNTGNYESLIAHDNANNSLYLKTAQTAKGLEIKADGDVNVIDGNLSFAAGHGIDFSANSHAGGMTSELLDDYEEGTFNLSPNLNNVSYTTQQFTYTKIGNVVHFSGRLSYSGASGVSDQLLGLPFLPNGIYVTSSFYVDSGLNIGSEDFFTVYTSPTASRMHMTTQSTATAYQMPGAADFYIAGFYKTNS